MMPIKSDKEQVAGSNPLRTLHAALRNTYYVLRITGYILLIIPCLCPFLLLLLGSLWPDYQPLSAIWQIFQNFQPTLTNYHTAATLVPLAHFAFNSLQVILMAVPLTLLVASLAGFALLHLPHRIQTAIVWFSLGALLAPPTALWLARFPIFKALGWVDTPWPLVSPALIGGTPFFVLLFYWGFRRLSPAFFEAAILEGASPWQVWWHVALPMSSNTVAGVTILSFVMFWGNFTDPLLYLRSESQMTLPVGLRMLAQLDPTRWPVLMAGAVLLTLPVVVVFLVGQRFFWHGWQVITSATRREN
jgi:multiple sugar transport system permease protein